MRSDKHSAICAILVIYFKCHPDDDPVESKHVAVRIFYTVTIEGYLSTAHSLASSNRNTYLFINTNQLDALNFIISLFQASTRFEHMCSKRVEA